MENHNKIKAGIVGGAGYTGGETLRLLINHPHVHVAFVQSRSQAGKAVSDVHQDLTGETDLVFSLSIHPADVIFLCLGHGESKKFLLDNSIDAATKIIDLSQDFRLGDKSGERTFVYGLPEFQKAAIQKADNIANPGCFATAIQLGLLPLAQAGLLRDIHTTGITGSTGAGQQLQETAHFSWRANNISAYKTLAHQHLNEINMTLGKLQPGYSNTLYFVPWRGDFTRGIFISSVIQTDLSLAEVRALYEAYYKTEPFVHISGSMIDLKQVVNANKCLIYLEKVGDRLVVHSATDNLLKGASGQAVQNMNLMFGVGETAGLKLKPTAF